MEIPLQAHVACTDGICGRSASVPVNPVIEQITCLVVSETPWPHAEVIVPLDLVSGVTAGTTLLRCSEAGLAKLDLFVQTRFVEMKLSDLPWSAVYGTGPGTGAYLWPHIAPAGTISVPVETGQIPPGELAVRRATRVEAPDGYVGHVDEFAVDPENGHITYVISGEVSLELDDGIEVHLHPGDSVVQNGTRHRWRKGGSEPCQMAVIMLGARCQRRLRANGARCHD
jgi:mannose-6-phosphate isomerase-like protein (cupin superfamily)